MIQKAPEGILLVILLTPILMMFAGLGLGYGVLSSYLCTLHTFWDTIIPYRTESVVFFGAYELSNEVRGLFTCTRTRCETCTASYYIDLQDSSFAKRGQRIEETLNEKP